MKSFKIRCSEKICAQFLL